MNNLTFAAMLGYDICFADVVKGTQYEAEIEKTNMVMEINMLCNSLKLDYKFNFATFDIGKFANLMSVKDKDEYSYYTLGFVLCNLELKKQGVLKGDDEYISRLLSITNFPLTSSKIIDYLKSNPISMSEKDKFEDYVNDFDEFLKSDPMNNIYEDDDDEEE